MFRRNCWFLPLVAVTFSFSSMKTCLADKADSPKGSVALLDRSASHLAPLWTSKDGSAPKWKSKNGIFTASGDDIITKERYTDCQLHVEFKVPYLPNRKGQARGNSGVKLQGRYEVQILDCFGKETPDKGDCGGIYDQVPPLVNACKAPNEWQTYEITFRAPRMGPDGKVKENARITVIQNGLVVQNNTEIAGVTGDHPYDREIDKPGPLLLQYHGSAVQFRNVWILPLPLEGAKHY